MGKGKVPSRKQVELFMEEGAPQLSSTNIKTNFVRRLGALSCDFPLISLCAKGSREMAYDQASSTLLTPQDAQDQRRKPRGMQRQTAPCSTSYNFLRTTIQKDRNSQSWPLIPAHNLSMDIYKPTIPHATQPDSTP